MSKVDPRFAGTWYLHPEMMDEPFLDGIRELVESCEQNGREAFETQCVE